MSKNLESLSALMDSEATELELRRALKGCSKNPAEADTWRRYHLARTLMSEQKIDSTVDISMNVMSAIDDLSDQRTRESRSTWTAMSSMAVAASLTLAVMLGLNATQFSDSDSLATNGVLERSQGSSSLVRTSLQGDTQSTADDAPSLEVIRLSEGLSVHIDEHLALLEQPATNWQVTWLPEGFAKVADRITPDAEVMIFQNQTKQISVVVKSMADTLPSEGAYSNQGLVAVGRIAGEKFISVVGDISLTDADHVAANVVIPTLVK